MPARGKIRNFVGKGAMVLVGAEALIAERMIYDIFSDSVVIAGSNRDLSRAFAPGNEQGPRSFQAIMLERGERYAILVDVRFTRIETLAGTADQLRLRLCGATHQPDRRPVEELPATARTAFQLLVFDGA